MQQPAVRFSWARMRLLRYVHGTGYRVDYGLHTSKGRRDGQKGVISLGRVVSGTALQRRRLDVGARSSSGMHEHGWVMSTRGQSCACHCISSLPRHLTPRPGNWHPAAPLGITFVAPLLLYACCCYTSDADVPGPVQQWPGRRQGPYACLRPRGECVDHASEPEPQQDCRPRRACAGQAA